MQYDRLQTRGQDRPYDPAVDNPFTIPAFGVTAWNKDRILDALRLATGGKIVVLLFHGAPDHRQETMNCSLSLFEEYLKYLTDNRYTVIAMRDLARYVPKASEGKSCQRMQP